MKPTPNYGGNRDYQSFLPSPGSDFDTRFTGGSTNPSRPDNKRFGFYANPSTGVRDYFDPMGWQSGDYDPWSQVGQPGGHTIGDMLGPAPEFPQWMKDARDRAIDLYTEQSSPDFSLFSPQARDAADRRVGSVLANADRSFRSGLGARGISGSGMAEQYAGDLQNKAAQGLADISADFSAADAQHRRDSAQMLEQLYRYGNEDFVRASAAAMGLPLDYANAVAPTVLQGPEIDMPDFSQWMESNINMDMLEYGIEQAINEGRINAGDIIKIMTQATASGVSIPMALAMAIAPNALGLGFGQPLF